VGEDAAGLATCSKVRLAIGARESEHVSEQVS